MPNWVDTDLNRVCALAEVQCTVTMDPSDYQKVYQFKHLGSYGVEITHDRAVYILNPGDEFSLKVRGDEEPKITQWFVFYDRAFNR